MIQLPKSIVDPGVLAEATGISEDRLKLSCARVSIEKSSLTLHMDIRLNFMMPRKVERQIKEGMKAQLGNIEQVRIAYIYEQDEAISAADLATATSGEKSPSQKKPCASAKSQAKGKDPDVLLGKRIREAPSSYEDVKAAVQDKAPAVIAGRVFAIDQRPIKSSRYILTLLISQGARAMCLKAFVRAEEMAVIQETIEEGDQILAQGHPEYDTYEHEVVFMAQSINKTLRETREDRYPGKHRVELHAHTKMSDNDGFNDVEDLVRQAAAWGQPAVAITDHGVVQAFPDAAKTARELAKAGKPIKILYGMEGYLYPDEDALLPDGSIDIRRHGTYHIILIARNLIGLRNLYKLVSYTHMDYFYKRPRLPRSVLEAHREGLIVGSACEAGELYQAILNGADEEELRRIASYYDYLEIQPLGNNQFLLDEMRLSSRQALVDINRKILALGDALDLPVVATTDAHYPDADASIYRNIIMSGMGFRDTPSDALYLRTTEEMLEEFSYLGERAEEVVIENTNRLADTVEVFEPVPSEKCPPHIDGADERLRESCYARAKNIYGDPLPSRIRERLDVELDAIIGNGYAVMYVAAQMLVEKSLEDGYLVGSRGSVGSSFAATMAGITEVNPLEPHYVCPNCQRVDFLDELGTADVHCDCGLDMPERDCPDCGTRMRRDGLTIPFATFLGFSGDKEPDIDLNFAGEYQQTAHHYVGKIFGEKNIFKAGTVSTIKDRTAYGYVRHYLEDRGLTASKYDIDWLTRGCTGVKRTTGQHPGGIIVVPEEHEIYEFCPIQRPANKRDAGVVTTHFDYHKIDKNLLKLDILGHDVPQMIRHLQDMTGVDPLSIDLSDPKTLSIFTSMEALNIENPEYRFVHATYAIPEFGTNFTRAMLDDIRPTTISALIKISGFSHGTDVWTNNAQNLIRSGQAGIDELISCRDDIMNYLMFKGVDNSNAFHIMEDVRKNRELNDEELRIMKEHDVPDWYVQSCRTLKYLFPRAHAAAYVMMAIRMAWFKVYYPNAFYAAWLSTKIDNFDIDCFQNGIPGVEHAMAQINALGNAASVKQKDQLTVYEVIYELLSRGCRFSMPELGVSDPCLFSVIDGEIKIPFMAVSGVGNAAADSLAEAYREQPFTSLDDVRRRTRLSATNIEDLRRYGVFGDIPDSAQVSIFDL